jgi:hypothetical protein
MTPKLKAQELIHKFTHDISLFWDLSYINAIDCALISVDELIELSKYTDGYYEWDYFYEEVKKELLNLKNK